MCITPPSSEPRAGTDQAKPDFKFARAQFLGLAGCLFLGCAAGSASVPAAEPEPTLKLLASTQTVAKHSRIEFKVQPPIEPVDPFDPRQARLDLRVKTPSGKELLVPGFYHQTYEQERLQEGGDRNRAWLYPGTAEWVIRFAPMETGEYEVRAEWLASRKDVRSPAPSGGAPSKEEASRPGSLPSPSVSLDGPGQFLRSEPMRFVSEPSAHRGWVRVSQRDPRFLELSEGGAFFPVGQNLAFIGTQQYVTPARAESIFETLGKHGANCVRIWAGCEDWAMGVEARKSAWARSWNWNPPMVEMPGADPPGRKCLTLSPERPLLKMEPSHPVALRPGTRYRFSARLLVEPAATVTLTVNGQAAGVAPRSSNRQEWAPFVHEFTAGGRWLGETSFRLAGEGKAWLADLSVREAGGSPELLWEAEVNRPTLGFYNPVDASQLDQVLEAAERHGIYVQLCLLTRDLYMDRLKDPASPAYDAAIADAKRLFRYAVARWGAFPNLAVWEYWNEMNPNLPTDRFYQELGDYLRKIDVYGHLRSTSTWGPSAKDAAHPALDLADTHFYLRLADRGRLDDEVAAVLDRARWLRQVAPAKPVLLGEFGLADDQWRITDDMKRSPELADLHNGLWTSALSGMSGTTLFWWWERLDQRSFYPAYRSLTRFIRDIPWTSGTIRDAVLSTGQDRLRLVGLRTDNAAWLWVFDREASWNRIVGGAGEPSPVRDSAITLDGLPDGPCRVEWWDTRRGEVLRQEHAEVIGQRLTLGLPEFRRDIAARVRMIR